MLNCTTITQIVAEEITERPQNWLIWTGFHPTCACSFTSVYFLSTWTCCAQPQDSSRKWRQGGDGGSQFHSGFPLDYKLILTGPVRLCGTFVKLSLFGRRTEWSRVEPVLDNKRPHSFFGVFLSKVQGGHPVELAVAWWLQANVKWYTASSWASLSTSCALRSIQQQSSCSSFSFDDVHVCFKVTMRMYSI